VEAILSASCSDPFQTMIEKGPDKTPAVQQGKYRPLTLREKASHGCSCNYIIYNILNNLGWVFAFIVHRARNGGDEPIHANVGSTERIS